MNDLKFTAEDSEYRLINYHLLEATEECLSKNAYLGKQAADGIPADVKEVSYISIEKANRILEEKLKAAPVVYGPLENGKDGWHPWWLKWKTHKARLVCIEEIIYGNAPTK